MRNALFAATFLCCLSCTAIDVARVPSSNEGPQVFVTAGDLVAPHEVLGLVQATRSGVLLFGFLDPAGTDLEAGFNEVLVPQVRAMGGDGAVRARFRMTQYTPWARVFGAIFFFVPLPTEVTITAQVVRLRRGADAQAVPSASPPSSL